MSYLKAIIPVLIVVLITGCPASRIGNAPVETGKEIRGDLKGQIIISGAFALYPLILKMSEDFIVLHPGVKILVNKNGTGEGITDLLARKSLLVMISRPLTDEEINEGIWVIPIAKDGVAPIVNQKNPYLDKLINQGINPEEFLRIFTSEKPMVWGDVLGTKASEKIKVYTRADESGAAEVWADFLYKKPEDLRGIGVTGDDDMIKSIQDDPLAVGFCNFSYAFDPVTGERIKDIQIIPVDLDFDNKIERKEMPFANLEEAHRSLWLGFYPDDLCRELTIGSLGKPTDQSVIEFLYYILGEGQTNVKRNGFCPLNNVYLNYAKELLE